VSKKLYSTGKISQQALLEIEIRRTEIERELINNKFEILKAKDELKYFISKNKIDMNSVPWKILDEKKNNYKDYKELAFKEMIKAKKFSVISSQLNFVPDLVLSAGFTKRSNLDGKGDFASASLSFSLPLSAEKYSNKNKAVKEQEVLLKAYKNYKKLKETKLLAIEKEILKLKGELKILNSKTIYYAKNSRSITSKSYGIGNSSYSELLNSELKLQKILMHKVMLEARLALNKVKLKFIKGDDLNE
jgi:outer membrane protein TolC